MTKPKSSFYEVLNKSEATKTVDIMVYGFIPEMDWDTYKVKNTAEKFVKDFKALEKDYDRINVRINSPGGSLYHGFAIFNALVSSKKDIHTYLDGLAFSLGGLLLFAGKTVHAPKSSGMVMIHNGSSALYGNAKEMRDMADIMDKYDEQIAGIVANKTGKPVEDVKAEWLNYKDNFLTPQEAFDAGLVDVLEDYSTEQVPENVQNMSQKELMNLFNKATEAKNEDSFLNKLSNKLVTHLRDVFPNNKAIIEPENNISMDFKNSLALLDAGNLTDENIATIKAEITAFTGESEKFTAAEVNAKVKEANDAKAAAEAEKATAEQELAKVTAELEKLKNDAGAPPATPPVNGQEKLEGEEDDVKAILDSLPHNKKYDESQY